MKTNKLKHLNILNCGSPRTFQQDLDIVINSLNKLEPDEVVVLAKRPLYKEILTTLYRTTLH